MFQHHGFILGKKSNQAIQPTPTSSIHKGDRLTAGWVDEAFSPQASLRSSRNQPVGSWKGRGTLNGFILIYPPRKLAYPLEDDAFLLTWSLFRWHMNFLAGTLPATNKILFSRCFDMIFLFEKWRKKSNTYSPNWWFVCMDLGGTLTCIEKLKSHTNKQIGGCFFFFWVRVRDTVSNLPQKLCTTS